MEMNTKALQHIVKQSSEVKTYEAFIDEQLDSQWRDATDQTKAVLGEASDNLTHTLEVTLEASDRLAVLLAYGGDELQTIINRAEKDNFCKVVSQLKSYSGELFRETLDDFACEQVPVE